MPEHLDYAIIGGGLSGVGAACYYLQQYPGANKPQSKLAGNSKTFAIFEGRKEMGGTWSLFKYPGIRSDSDMLSFAFSFNPWTDFKNVIAPGDMILKYVKSTADKYGVSPYIRYSHRAKTMSWSSTEKVWTIIFDKIDADTGAPVEEVTVTAKFLMMCTGYYEYEKGFTPSQGPWATIKDDFKGQIVHPQQWPENFSYEGKKVVVIGSGATAITLVPNMAAAGAKHVTMLQRSPTWMVSLPTARPLPWYLRWIPVTLASRVQWYATVLIGHLQFCFCRAYPAVVGNLLKKLLVKREKVPQTDVEKHFSPRYNVWDERFCVVANGDLFKHMREGRVSVVTGHIDRFVENGILLKPATTAIVGSCSGSDEVVRAKEIVATTTTTEDAAATTTTAGEVIEADIIVTATGLNVQLFGGAKLFIDGKEQNPFDHIVYRGVMVSGIPNFAIAIGYTNASWTLKIELAFQLITRLQKEMDRRNAAVVTPTPAPHVAVTERSVFDLASGYVQRANAFLPRQGSEAPWQVLNNYPRDYFQIAMSSTADPALVYAS